MVRLADRHDWRWGIYSAEKQRIEIHLYQLYQKLFRRNFFHQTISGPRITRTDIEKYRPWMDDHFKFIEGTESDTSVDGLITKCSQLVRRYGIRGFVIDNWMHVDKSGRLGRGNDSFDEDEATGELAKLHQYCNSERVMVILVAHPKKMAGTDKTGGKERIAGGYDVLGTSGFYNVADVGITVYRDFEQGMTAIKVWKVRWFFTGKPGTRYLSFNEDYEGYESADGADPIFKSPLERSNDEVSDFYSITEAVR
jgi:hypothetical protein